MGVVPVGTGVRDDEAVDELLSGQNGVLRDARTLS